jgi:hypothetical protein
MIVGQRATYPETERPTYAADENAVGHGKVLRRYQFSLRPSALSTSVINCFYAFH